MSSLEFTRMQELRARMAAELSAGYLASLGGHECTTPTAEKLAAYGLKVADAIIKQIAEEAAAQNENLKLGFSS